MNFKKIVKQILDEEYNREIMTINVDWMKATYDKFNKLYWNGALPSNLSFSLNGRLKTAFANALFKYSSWQPQSDGTYVAGIESITGIEFSTKNEGETWVFEATMLHEMIHIADFYFHPEHFSLIYKNGRTSSNFKKGGYDCHGDIFFKKEAQRLGQYGWDIQKLVTAEENAALMTSQKAIQKKQKALKAKQNKVNKAYARWKQIRYTIDAIIEKAQVLNKYVANKTNNFTQPMPNCTINIGPLKIIFSNKYDWRGEILEPSKEDSESVKYKAIIYIGQGMLSSIKEKGFGGSINNIDLGYLFEEEYNEMYDLEDEYGF